MVEAKNEFRALLKETKAITYRSHEMIKESNKHYKDIIDVLEVAKYCYRLQSSLSLTYLLLSLSLFRKIGDSLSWSV